MAVYMIAYELHEGEDYEGDLIKAIKSGKPLEVNGSRLSAVA